MLLNYLKITWRNLLRNKGYATLNLLGLAIGMTGALIILLWIQHEVSFDRFHRHSKDLYEAYHRFDYNGTIHHTNYTSEPLGASLLEEYPEILNVARYDGGNHFYLKYEDMSFKQHTVFMEPSFFDMFDFEFLLGNKESAFNVPNAIVLTAELADKFFGREDPIGKVIQMQDEHLFTVTGVLKPLPTNTRFAFEAVLDWKMKEEMGYYDQSPHSWSNSYVNTFVQLYPKSDIAAVNQKIIHVSRKKDEVADMDVLLYPSSRWHLYNRFENGKAAGGRIDRVYMFGAIGIFILLIACINFMNLSTARSQKRAKEVGIRKTIGAERQMLIFQFISESVLLACISGLIALGLVYLLIPYFGQMIGQQFLLPVDQMWFWLSYIAFIMVTGFMAGSYPAFMLSSFRPASVLKGTFIKRNAVFEGRKILVVVQFCFAIGLILCTLIVRQQIKFASERDLGYDQDHLITLYLNNTTRDKAELIRNDLISSNAVSSVTRTGAAMTRPINNSSGIEWEGKQEETKLILYRYGADRDWVKTTGVQLVAGRDINIDLYATDSTAMLINETAARLMGYEDPIGKVVYDSFLEYTIVGVFKDFLITSPFGNNVPLLVAGPSAYLPVFTAKLNPDGAGVDAQLATIHEIFRKHDPDHPLEYEFVDQQYAANFKSEKQTSLLTATFSSVSIFISCLGLFGLAAFTAEQRKKEIGVRKVLGASVSKIVYLLSMEFIKLVAISFVIAVPITYYIMEQWLDNFQYKTVVGWDLFVITGLVSLSIAIITVTFQSLKAAIQNPVNALISE
ncbi:ABC transporter permease [Anditalea andensis]|uniref:ABC transporter permease n=1 Tax=Anditalea andensis TaxID=1048983 RepID=A0A074KSS4_9BACT|nr:ABC transporter permease [Anditalea andensis]KEO71974.1 hypothetical protein EL17_20895 [Anditalea andensis]